MHNGKTVGIPAFGRYGGAIFGTDYLPRMPNLARYLGGSGTSEAMFAGNDTL
jgi:hypothetical protein